MKQLILIFAAVMAAHAQAVMTVASDGCRTDTLTWNGVSIGLVSNLANTFTYDDGLGGITTYGDTACSGASSKSKGTSPESLTQVWRSGTSRETTIRVEVTNPSSSRIQQKFFITNNGTETITNWRLGLIGFTVGEPFLGNCSSASDLIRTSRFSPDYFLYAYWTNVVASVWMGDMSQNAYVNIGCNVSGTTRTPQLRATYTSELGDQVDTITPGQTREYTVYYSFYPSGTTFLEAGKEATIVYGSASGPRVNWPDRRPVGVWFWSESQYRTANNPRGYLSASLNALDPPTMQSYTMTQVNNVINIMNARSPRPQGIILWSLEGYELRHAFTYIGHPDRLSIMAPEMDAIADQIFTAFKTAGYRVGLTIRPTTFRLHTPTTRLSWAITGGTLASLVVSGGVATATTSTAHGLSTGFIVTIRRATTTSLNSGRKEIIVTGANTFTFTTSAPDATYTQPNIVIGYADLPPTCFHSPTGGDDSDYLLLGPADIYPTYSYPSVTRSASCGATNEWGFNDSPFGSDNGGPGEQTRSNDYSVVMAQLRAKVQYAASRWGVTIFYVDTNVGISGTTMINKVWQDLLAEFPSYLFIPEWEAASTYQNAAPYLDFGNNNPSDPRLDSSIMQGNQASFAVVAPGDRNINTSPTTTDQWKTTLLRGTSPLTRAWFGDVQVTRLNTMYTDIEPTSRCVTVANRNFCAAPRTSFTYPLVNRVYFASSQGGLTASNFYCEQTDVTRCYQAGVISGTYDIPVDPGLSGMTHYEIRYYGFDGSLVSKGPYATLQ